jgi:hypothetical protein
MKKPRITIENSNNIKKYIFEVPKDFKLFRMRPNNNYSTDAFINDEIWGTTADSFNDPYDTTYIYDKNELFNYTYNKLINEEELRVELLFTDEHVLNYTKELIKSIVNNNTTRNLMAIACFTEKIDNEIMWAHYANNAQGFALEYSYNDLVNFGKKCEESAIDTVKGFYENLINYDMEEERMPSNLVPIIYDNKKYNMTEDFKKIINLQIKNLKITCVEQKQLSFKEIVIDSIESTKDSRKDFTSFWEMNCLKKREWAYEHEWRLLAFNLNSFSGILAPHFRMGFLKPTAIYLGERISDYDKQALMQIAKTKNIKVFQMYSRMTKRTNKLAYKEIK